MVTAGFTVFCTRAVVGAVVGVTDVADVRAGDGVDVAGATARAGVDDASATAATAVGVCKAVGAALAGRAVRSG